jgi:hypothetical protein
MPQNATAREHVSLGSPSCTYGGMFDLINTDDALSAAELKFMALFYDAVIVPDAFLMSYTPLFRHIHRLPKDASSPDQDTVSVFLREGVIVPALRRGDSLLDNRRLDGSIVPGNEMRIDPEEGRIVLGFVDSRATKVRTNQSRPSKK